MVKESGGRSLRIDCHPNQVQKSDFERNLGRRQTFGFDLRQISYQSKIKVGVLTDRFSSEGRWGSRGRSIGCLFFVAAEV